VEGIEVTLKIGLPEEMRADAALLYLDAFDLKLGPILGRDERAVGYMFDVLELGHALIAMGPDGDLVGLAGFHDHAGGLVGGGFGDLWRWYGFVGACWRGALLSFFERAPGGNQLLMDGVVVTTQARGKGVGGKLLEGMEQIAQVRALDEIRLDVVDTNPRARALYEREGFVPAGEESVWPLHHVFGFRRATTMVKAVPKLKPAPGRTPLTP